MNAADINPDTYLKCKAQWEEEELFLVDEVQHHSPVLQIM